MDYGIQNTVTPPAPQVNTADYNTILLAGIAPKGPTNELILCATDTDDSQFGDCLDNFDIPRALRTIRLTGGGKVVVINTFDATAHTTQVTNEEQAVDSQKVQTAFDPTDTVVVTNKVITAAGASMQLVAAATTGGGGTIPSILIGGVELLASTLTVAAGTNSATATAVAGAINANTSVSKYSAVASSGNITLTADSTLGATVNGLVPTITSTGTVSITIGTPAAMQGGVTGVSAHTYSGTEFSIDSYGRIKFLVAVPDTQIVRLTYKKLNTSITNTIATAIIGGVNGTTRTGLALIEECASVLGLVPKLLIVPTYNKLVAVQTAMSSYASTYRMRDYYSCAGLTRDGAVASRGPGGPQATFVTPSKRAQLLFDEIFTYNPKTGTNTLDDPSALAAGFMSANAVINGPHVSPSNQAILATSGSEARILLKYEDPSQTSDANILRKAGIICFPTVRGKGTIWWGGENASSPDNTAVDVNITTMYVNDIITDSLTQFATQYIDKNITTGSITAFVTAANGYYSSLKVLGWIGNDSEVKYLKSRNPDADLAQGKIKFTRFTYYFVAMKFIRLEENMEVQIPVVTA